MLTLGVVDLAHIAKYKASACGHMLAHYRRDKASLERDNIDTERTHLNVTVQLCEDGKVRGLPVKDGQQPNWETIERRIEKVNERAKTEGRRQVRKDAVVMADIVVTLPENVRPADRDRFFRLTYIYIGRKLGYDNLMGGFVHRDEVRTKKNKETGEIEKTGERVRDHMHVPFTPITKDGRFNYKQMVPRSFYKTLHKELGDFLEQKLGYRPEVELDEGKAAQKAFSKLDHKELEEARRQIIEPAKAEAREIVQAAEERNAELNEAIADKQGDLVELDAAVSDKEFELRDARERLERLRQAGDRAAERVEQLESIAADARRFEAEGRAGKSEILNRIIDGCDSLASRIRERVRELAGIARRAAQRVSGAREPRMGLADAAREMRRGSAALRRGEGHGRNWEAER